MKFLESIVKIKNAQIAIDEHIVLSEVNFDLARGEFCYIMGTTGSGKSSFIKALYGAANISGDEVLVLDQDVTQLTRETLPYHRRKLGVIFQDNYLLEDQTVLENLDLVLRATNWVDAEKRKARIEEVLIQLDIAKLKTMIVNRLSSGEKRKLVIARAILNKPSLILADEPTAHLSHKDGVDFIQLMYNHAMKTKASLILCTLQKTLIESFPARTYLCADNKMTLSVQ